MLLMMKLQISKKTRSLNNVFQTAADHFPDVSNMVVSSYERVIAIRKSHTASYITNQTVVQI
ncbi:hypothetical protein DSECCO2_399110 [anaerobic digester metagenome]